MCLNHEQQQQQESNDKTPTLQNADIPMPVSPWGRLFKQVAKPKLKHTTKINLNKYWSKFGELMTSPSKSKLVVKSSSPTQIRAKKQLRFSEGFKATPTPIEDNSKNEIIRDRFVLLDEGIDENIANEIKEIWSYKKTECHICSVH